MENLRLVLLLGFLFNAQAFARSVNGPDNVPAALPSTSYDNGLQSIVDQLASNQTNHTTGHRLVIVYETPDYCAPQGDSIDTFSTETEYVTITKTTDVYVTRTPENCGTNKCEPSVETVCVTSTYTTVHEAHVTVSSDDNSDHKNENPRYSNDKSSQNNIAFDHDSIVNDQSSDEKTSNEKHNSGSSDLRKSDDRISPKKNSKDTDNNFASSERKAQGTKTSGASVGNFMSMDSDYWGSFIKEDYGFSPVPQGVFAINIIATLNFASTSTIFENGPTSSVSYDSIGTPLTPTKKDPLFDLETLAGPDVITVSHWEFTASVSTGAEFSYGYEATRVGERPTSHATDSVRATASTAKPHMSDFGIQQWNQSHTNSTTSIPLGIDEDISASPSPVNSSELQPAFVDFKPIPTCVTHQDLFEMISTVDPGQFYEKKPHPLAVPAGVSNDLPYQTNKFYTNLFMENQDEPVYTYPYVVYLEHELYYGLGVQNINPSRRHYDGVGAQEGTNAYYYDPHHVAGVFVGATSFGKGKCHVAMSKMRSFSALAKLSASIDAKDHIEFPLVQGMGFVTAVYHGDLVPKIQGNGGISEFEKLNFTTESDITQTYRVNVGTKETWLVSVTLPHLDDDFELRKENGSDFLVGSKAVEGIIIQIALAPPEAAREAEKIYHDAAGQYLTGAQLSGSIACEQVDYKISFQSEGKSACKSPLVFALPHHINLFSEQMKDRASNILAPTSTKGLLQGYLTNEFSFSHQVDSRVQWFPYLKEKDNTLRYTREQIELISEAATKELDQVDIIKTVQGLDKQYETGKAIDKYAYILYVVNEILKNDDLGDAVLNSLKKFFEKYKAEKGKPVLFYDTKFKGVTSSGAFIDVVNGVFSPKGEPADYGSGVYNDHNFHYAYYIHAAAVIGKIDASKGGNWASENKDFINTLVRDVANPSEEDPFFPVFRSFDWYQGHSWAHGVTPMRDGKDLESTSEDVNFSYAMKLWGQVIGDKAMEARGDLMLSIQERAFDSYFLYKDNNVVVQPSMLKNKVSGILFEGKLAYETWFGKNPEYIHGIQMLPITPALGSVRNATFAKEEWSQIVGKLSIKGKWAGILNSNQVFFDAKSSWDYFANPDFDYKEDLDGGQSRVWALAYAAPFVNQDSP